MTKKNKRNGLFEYADKALSKLTNDEKEKLQALHSERSEKIHTINQLLKAYSSIIMTKDFQRMNIIKLPVFTTEAGIKRIKTFLGNAFIKSFLIKSF